MQLNTKQHCGYCIKHSKKLHLGTLCDTWNEYQSSENINYLNTSNRDAMYLLSGKNWTFKYYSDEISSFKVSTLFLIFLLILWIKMTGRLYRSERFNVFRCLRNCPIRTYVCNPSPISICYRGQPKRIIQGELKTTGKAGEGKISIRYKAPSK
jgi:hypothetical protein